MKICSKRPPVWLALALAAALWMQPLPALGEVDEVEEVEVAGVAVAEAEHAELAELAEVPVVAEVAEVAGSVGVEAAVAPAAERAPPTVPELIVDAAGRYGLSSERMLRIGWCESRWDPAARGPGGAAGVFQFVPQTWAWASVGAGVGGQSPFDAASNVEAAAWVMATDGYHHWGCR